MNSIRRLADFQRSHIRYQILILVFVVTAISFADRSIISIAGADIANDLAINDIMMGFVFSAFSWAYVIGQIPGGLLIDKYGVRIIYGILLLVWSLLSLLHGFVAFMSVNVGILVLLLLRFSIGLISAPLFPANAKIIAEWFPAKERGFATAVFTSAQYFSVVLFAPVIGWMTNAFGWEYLFFLLSIISILCAFKWLTDYDSPSSHKRISHKELVVIQQGGALPPHTGKTAGVQGGKNIAFKMLGNRTLIGIYIAQYSATVITYFFLTWFPIYLITEKQMSVLQVGFVSIFPALSAFIGSLLGGICSDALIRKGFTRSKSRKIPIISGLLLSTTIIAADYMNSTYLVIAVMSLAFFGRGFGGLGWAVVSETSSAHSAGLNGALFNTFGNIAGITTPIFIGFIIQHTGSFNLALLYVGCNALLAIVCYAWVVEEIKPINIQ